MTNTFIIAGIIKAVGDSYHQWFVIRTVGDESITAGS
jgi:hypothetical protein